MNRREDWTIRLKEELKNATYAHFVTLTYSDDNLKFGRYAPTLDKTDLQKFFKRLRKNSRSKNLRYYAVGEYGTKTMRPHYHIILFNLYDSNLIDKSWQLGNIQVGEVTGGSIHYVTKYHVNKTDYPEGTEKPFALMSKRPAIGSYYVEKMNDYHSGYPQRAYYTELGGVKKRLPRFFKTKLYSKEDLTLIANANNIIATNSKQKSELDFKNSNPNKNYFEYDTSLKEELIRNYKQKSNYNNKI